MVSGRAGQMPHKTPNLRVFFSLCGAAEVVE